VGLRNEKWGTFGPLSISMADFLKNVGLIVQNMGKLIDPFRGSTYYRGALQGGELPL